MKKILFIPFLLLSISVFPQSMAFISGGGGLCSNAGTIDVQIDLNGSSPWNIVYAIDGISQAAISTSINPHIIATKKAGVYTVVSVSDAAGVGTTSGSAIVTNLQAPKASFSIIPDTISVNYPIAQFRDKTISATLWYWNFGDNSPIDNSQNPTHFYPIDTNGIGIPAIYQVTLIATNADGCSDTTFRQVWITDEYHIYIPSSFTPDLDGVNDNFCLQYHAIREHTFDFKIYNLRGDVVFHSKNIKGMVCDNLNNNGWDGRHNKSGKELPIGNYVYEVYFQDFEGWKHHDFGFLHLIR